MALWKVGGEEEGDGEDAVGVSCVAGRRVVSSGLRFLAPFLMTLHIVANQSCSLAGDLGSSMKAPETPDAATSLSSSPWGIFGSRK